MEQKNLEELYHKGELEWEEGEYTVCRGFQWTPPGCHNSCGILYYLKDSVMDHAEGDPLFPYNNGRLCARCLNLHEAGYQENRLKARCWRESALLENGGHCSPQQLLFDFPSEKRVDGMIKGTIVLIDNSLHNPDYHEL